MVFKFRFPHYFSSDLRRQIGELYISTAIADMALAIVMIFEPIYLYNVLGFSIVQILLFFAAVYMFYIVLIPYGARVVSKYGYEHGILFSIPFQIMFWFLLFGAQQNIMFAYIAPIVFAIEKSLYWPAFHASVARFAKDGQRGREFSVLHAIINIVYIVGPIVGGLLAQYFGAGFIFILASVIYMTSFIPLFTTKEVFVPKIYQFKDTWMLYKTFPYKALGYMGFGEELLFLTIWPVFIFFSVQDYSETGSLVTIATLIATILGLYIGKQADMSRERWLISKGALLLAFTWFGRVFTKHFWSIFIIDSLSRTFKEVVIIPLSAVTYKRAEETHIMPYVVFYEQSLAVGKLLAALIGVIVFAAIAPTFGEMVGFYALFALGGLFSLLYRLI